MTDLILSAVAMIVAIGGIFMSLMFMHVADKVFHKHPILSVVLFALIFVVTYIHISN